MKGVGASSRLWQLVDRVPAIPSSGGKLEPNLKILFYTLHWFALGGKVLPSSVFQGSIEFQNVGFSYPARLNAPIFRNLTLTLPPGSVTAVVGMSGSGKSTLASLLLRLYDVDFGQVLVDGYNVKDLDPMWLRKHVGIVSQVRSHLTCFCITLIKQGILSGTSFVLYLNC